MIWRRLPPCFRFCKIELFAQNMITLGWEIMLSASITFKIKLKRYFSFIFTLIVPSVLFENGCQFIVRFVASIAVGYGNLIVQNNLLLFVTENCPFTIHRLL